MREQFGRVGVLRRLGATVREGRWVVVSFAGRPPFDLAFETSIREHGGLSAVVAEEEAERLKLRFEGVWGWIECIFDGARPPANGTAVVATLLAEAEIPHKVIAGIRGDHLLVPFDRREDALALLDEHSADRRSVRPAAREGPRPDGVAEVVIREGAIRLGQFLKFAGLVDSGAAVKPLLSYGRVTVNGSPEARRGRQLRVGDVVAVDGKSVAVG